MIVQVDNYFDSSRKFYTDLQEPQHFDKLYNKCKLLEQRVDYKPAMTLKFSDLTFKRKNNNNIVLGGSRKHYIIQNSRGN
jgi:hypothetical protein